MAMVVLDPKPIFLAPWTMAQRLEGWKAIPLTLCLSMSQHRHSPLPQQGPVLGNLAHSQFRSGNSKNCMNPARSQLLRLLQTRGPRESLSWELEIEAEIEPVFIAGH